LQSAQTIAPPTVRPGDKVRIVSPSWGGAGLFPHRLARGRKALDDLGLRTEMGSNALWVSDHVAGSAQQRADDLNDAFKDPEVRAIFCAIGGDHCNQVLPYVDWAALRRDPKPIVGFSDITVLLWAVLARTGVRSFYGPTVLTGLAEYPSDLDYTREHLVAALLSGEPQGFIRSSEAWTDEYLEWSVMADLVRPRRLTPNAGPRTLRRGKAQGMLVGGCLPSIMHLRGTPYWPELEGAILFWETPEGGYTPADVDSHLADLKLSGVFDQIAGMVIGRPYAYDQPARAEFERIVLQSTREWAFPIICDMDFGHTDPVCTLPIGASAALDGDATHLILQQSGCAR
jgi:muramoyltetrapeptide carboxypeptidase